MLAVIAFLFASGFFLLCFAAALYVIYRFASMAISLDAALFRAFSDQSRALNTQLADNKKIMDEKPIQESRLRDFIQSRMAPTEGEFVPASDEEAFINEQVEHLRRQGLTDDELDAFIRQAVGTDTVLPADKA